MSTTFLPSFFVPIVGFLGPLFIIGSFLYIVEKDEIK
jgi:hypothetical protein